MSVYTKSGAVSENDAPLKTVLVNVARLMTPSMCTDKEQQLQEMTCWIFCDFNDNILPQSFFSIYKLNSSGVNASL